MAPASIPEIETERLLLRGPRTGDVEVWASYIGDPDYQRYLPKRNMTDLARAERSLNIIAQAWEQHPQSDVAWLITEKATGRLMGWSAAGPSKENGDPELAYVLGKPYWGQGFATEAARAVVRYGFAHLGWNRIVAAIIPGNVASRRVLEHLGFIYEKDVNYYEMSGDTTFLMDSPIVPYFVLQRDQFAPGDAFYRVRSDAS